MTASRIAAIVSRVAQVHPLRPRCLERALTTSAVARSEGYQASVCIGATRTDGQMLAHAWAVIDGASVDSSASQYRRLCVLNGN